ncbi:hypothetical protein AXK57_19050 [Tsukamurella pulmonis]|uniref:DUF6670 family protein n=1 Tax=Tsukamurella pulmonis TaxID=47312 RepID=UPI0007962F5B|nr:DUF6670 family protein [Tsukamurella pulmonis]KXP12396.1 hypothetical protein AXK57_19050 [Tsukamurella pulmonis]RDH13371.1 hypothetical protein DVB88_02765 [Tsukamurella pulmonis]
MSRLVSTLLSRAVVDTALPLLDSRIAASRRPFEQAEILRPHTTSKVWSTTHFGVFVPDLPEPYRYVNTMTLIGAAGAELFDQDHLAATDARDTTTVLSSTAYGDQHFYRAYDASTECSFAADGSALRWGDELAIDVDLPRVTVRGRYPGFDVDLELEVGEQVSYFVKTPVYDHLSLLAPYTGTVDGDRVEGVGTFEYARIRSHQALSRRPVPGPLKLPIDFFTYQIIDIDPQTQILLTDVRARGRTACRLAHVRRLGEPAEVYEDVRMEVLESRELVDDRGRAMTVPVLLRWTVRDGDAEVLTIDGSVDSPLRYGHGRGYVGAYTYIGSYRDEPVAGSAYLEWIDTRG